MSIGMNPSAEQELSAPGTTNVKPKTNRRHGACNPCKESKTKCDGGTPCSACRAEKRKSRPCEYTKKARDIAAAREESNLRRQRDSNSSSSDEQYSKEELTIPGGPSTTGPALGPSSNPSASMHRKVSLCAIVEEFIQVKPGSRAREIQNIRRVEEEWLKFQTFLADPISNIEPLRRETVAQLDAWKMELQQILKQLNLGDLPGAWSSIAALLRRFSSWETFTPHVGESSSTAPFATPLSPNFLQERNAIYTQLVELDCALGFFLGDQSLQHDFDKSRLRAKVDFDGHSEDTIELFTTIRDMLKIDMTSEAGVWEFVRLQQHHETSIPSTPLQRMALCIYNTDPAERQAVKLTSCLVYAVMHCRTASVVMHYSQPGIVIPKPEDGSVDIIRELKLDQSRNIAPECTQVKKYAGHALAAFGKLCEIDAKNTAKSWIRLHSALIAAVLYGVYGLRERAANDNWQDYKKSLIVVEKQFQNLKTFNPDCPIFDHAIRILRSCDKKDLKVKRSSNKKRKLPIEDADDGSSSSDESDHGPVMRMLPTEAPNSRGQKREITSVSESISPSNIKRRKTIPTNRPSATTVWEPATGQEVQDGTQIQQNLARPTERAAAEHVRAPSMNTALFNGPYPHSGLEPILHQQPQQPTSTSNAGQYPYTFHPPLNPDANYWRQEGFALQTVNGHDSTYLGLVPLHQQQPYLDTSAQFQPGLVYHADPRFGIPFHSSNAAHVAPTPQYIEPVNAQQHVAPPPFHIAHEVDSSFLQGHADQTARPEAEGLSKVLSSPLGAPVQSWSNLPHTSSADISPTTYHPPMPPGGLMRRASEPNWQYHNQYNYPGQGYPYPNPADSQVHHMSFYDSRQHYPALENVNPNQHQ